MSDWHRGGVIYQIYPRSFCDSNNDGIGDLNGVSSKISYIKSLGVDGVWLSPFFRSPMKDFGYDVSDYRDVDPIFGTLKGFEALLKAAHAADLKVIIDQVYSHTSDQHEWFKESRSSKDNPKADWYVWADAKADGGPPNNWLSIFGGPAWEWDTRRRQYYLHNFLIEQPDLNFHNPQVRHAILDVSKFWLDRGVDGFRLDVANFYYCDKELRDNPPKEAGGTFSRPYDHQRHLYDRSQPETLAFMESLRQWMDAYPHRMSVAEIVSEDEATRCMEYCAPGRLSTAYSFSFLESDKLTAKLVRDTLEPWSGQNAWPSWSFSNHDVVRARSRWGVDDASDEFAKMLLGLLMCLRGTIFLYQGEELGLTQAQVPFDKLQDPEGIRFWPDNLGRDGARTPIPWRADEQNAGFSAAEPWLPVDKRHYGLSVDQQENDPHSTLNLSRSFIAFRKQHPALRLGDIEFIQSAEPLLMFLRIHEQEKLLCIFNLGAEEHEIAPPQRGMVLPYGLKGVLRGNKAILPAYGGLVINVAE